ncbi:MAG: hypothetical protein RLP09_09770 [Sandaracinaceae bacterium]
MSERLDRALELFERLVVAAERIADRDAKPAKRREPPPEEPVSETDRAAARARARRLGLVVRER